MGWRKFAAMPGAVLLLLAEFHTPQPCPESDECVYATERERQGERERWREGECVYFNTENKVVPALSHSGLNEGCPHMYT